MNVQGRQKRWDGLACENHIPERLETRPRIVGGGGDCTNDCTVAAVVAVAVVFTQLPATVAALLLMCDCPLIAAAVAAADVDLLLFVDAAAVAAAFSIAAPQLPHVAVAVICPHCCCR